MKNISKVEEYISNEYRKIYQQEVDKEKLNKLLYFVQRESFIVRNRPLFDACFYGTKYGVSVVNENHNIKNTLSKKEEEIINSVIDEYAKKSPMSLYRILYGEISWNNSRKHIDERGIGKKISNEDIRKDAMRIKERQKFLRFSTNK